MVCNPHRFLFVLQNYKSNPNLPVYFWIFSIQQKLYPTEFILHFLSLPPMRPEQRHILSRMNEMGKRKQPFVFLFDFDFQYPILLKWEESRQKLLWRTPRYSNFSPVPVDSRKFRWDVQPVSYNRYRESFNSVMEQIHQGNSYLLNLTMPSLVETALSLQDLLYLCHAPYQIYLKDHFLCFSPEVFVRIGHGQISSYPMKGTIDAAIPNAAFLLKNDRKELAEHATIVDLIRNDLSMVAEKIEVTRFCYLDQIITNKVNLFQMSSEITGQLPAGYLEHLGDIFSRLIPAGSICGAPKQKTVEIIKTVENYNRGYYTGIFGIFDGTVVDSCVLIRYLEKQNNQLIYKSGGGITHLSECKKEYQELIRKIYVPLA
jgi:para-aminobenzoate synthetase component 1